MCDSQKSDINFIFEFDSMVTDIKRFNYILPEEYLVCINGLCSMNFKNAKFTRLRLFLEILNSFSQNSLNFSKFKSIAISLELLQTAFLIWDDIIDFSIKRRNNYCWHKKVCPVNYQTFLKFLMFQQIILVNGGFFKT